MHDATNPAHFLGTPFDRREVSVRGGNIVVARPMLRMSDDGTVTKGVSEWTAGYRWSAGLSGEQLRDPAAENVWVASALSLRAEAVRSVKLCVYRSDSDDEADEVDASDPIARLLNSPNIVQSLADLLGRSIFHHADRGEDFWFLADVEGKPVASNLAGRIALPAQIIQAHGGVVSLSEETELGLPKTWQFSTARGRVLQFPEAATLRFIEDNSRSMFRGVGALQNLARELNAYHSAQRYMEGLAQNSGEMAGILLFKDMGDAEQVRAMQAKQDDFVSNQGNRGKYQVFGGTDVEWIPNQVAPKDMEFGTLFEWTRDSILSRFRVPLLLLGVHGSATYENLANARRCFWEDSIIPFLKAVETVINERLIKRLADPKLSRYHVEFDYDSIEALREDASDRIAKASGVSLQQNLPLNAVLPAFGVAPIEGGDAAPNPAWVSAGHPPDGLDPSNDTEQTGPVAGVDTAGQNLTGDGVQSIVLNGAQIQAAIGIVAQVTAGELPRDSGIEMLVEFFGIESDRAERIMGSAGTSTPTTANPTEGASEPATPADPSPPSGEASKQSAKSFQAVTCAAGPIVERAARVEYWNAHEKALGEPAAERMSAAAKKYLRRYAEAQVARIRAFVRDGKSMRTKGGRSFAADALTRDIAPDALIEEQLRILDLNRDEWDRKLREMFAEPLEYAAGASLRVAAAEIGTVSIGVQHPAVMSALQRQAIKLAGELNSNLEQEIRTTLLQALNDNGSTGDLQSRLQEVLPDVDGIVNRAIGDRPTRALRIARTESGKALSTARNEQFKHDGVKRIQWITQADGEVRESHANVDGDVVQMGSVFKNGLRYPLDPEGSASDVINCRCVYAAVLDEE